MFDHPVLSRPPEADRFARVGGVEPQVMDPKDRIAAWKRWEMGSFAEERPVQAYPSAAPEPAPEPAETVARRNAAELDTLRLKAQMAGEQSGYQQGYQQGYAQGQIEGHAAAMVAVHEQAGQLRVLALSLPSALREAESHVAADLLALAMDLARQVLGQALNADPQAILAVVHELLQAEPALVGTPQLFLHPDDAVLVSEHLSNDLQAVGWRIRSDTAMQRGGCRVMAHSGERDATIETRWARIASTLALHTATTGGAVP